MRKILFLFLIGSIFTLNMYAQSNKKIISFDTTVYDFGFITQEDKPIDFKYTYTNIGKKAVIINKVESGSESIETNYTQTPVKKGQQGTITGTFNHNSNPSGYFLDSILVFSDAKGSPKSLKLTGFIMKSENDLNKNFSHIFGDLRLSLNFVNFGNVFQNETDKKIELSTYNPTHSELSVKVENNDKPGYLTVNVYPEILQPGETGIIEFIYDASKVNSWDYVRANVYLTINGKRETSKRLQVSAVIKEKYTEEQLLHPPKIEFEEMSFSFDTINEGDVIVHEFNFTNTGESDLVIRKTQTSCGCTAVSLSNEPIKPGQTSTIKATFNSSHKRNAQTKTITVITNSPDEKYQKIVLRITGYVIPKE
ncbi:MAG: DUF1573 domain-containing protein [Bacteroidales bacterium]|nr:DUF1573 domain-containing protein [Bacteroidales bacterium]